MSQCPAALLQYRTNVFLRPGLGCDRFSLAGRGRDSFLWAQEIFWSNHSRIDRWIDYGIRGRVDGTRPLLSGRLTAEFDRERASVSGGSQLFRADKIGAGQRIRSEGPAG